MITAPSLHPRVRAKLQELDEREDSLDLQQAALVAERLDFIALELLAIAKEHGAAGIMLRDSSYPEDPGPLELILVVEPDGRGIPHTHRHPEGKTHPLYEQVRCDSRFNALLKTVQDCGLDRTVSVGLEWRRIYHGLVFGDVARRNIADPSPAAAG